MGIERMGPPDWLVDRVRERFRVRTFIETGSYLGETAAWAAMSTVSPSATSKPWPDFWMVTWNAMALL